MKILAIIGAPASGKSTLMLRMLATQHGGYVRRKYGLLEYMAFESFDVLGYYDDRQSFGGTDRLSNTVADDARKYLAEAGGHDRTVIFEGDKLATSPFLTYCRSIADTRIVLLEVDPLLLQQRRAAREFEVGKQQNPTWLRGRETKVKNLANEFLAERFCVDTEEQSVALAEHLLLWLTGQVAVEIPQPMRLF